MPNQHTRSISSDIQEQIRAKSRELKELFATQWMKRLSGLLLAGTLTACGNIGAQFSPIGEANEGAPSAKLRVLGGGGFVRGIPESNCLNWSKPGAGTIIGGIVGSNGFRGRSLDIPDMERIGNSPFAEIRVAAGKPFVLTFMTGPNLVRSCALSGSFIPEEGQDYEAEARIAGRVCHISVQKHTAAGTWETVPIQRATFCR
jgi:hypothetical protein